MAAIVMLKIIPDLLSFFLLFFFSFSEIFRDVDGNGIYEQKAFSVI